MRRDNELLRAAVQAEDWDEYRKSLHRRTAVMWFMRQLEQSRRNRERLEAWRRRREEVRHG